ncbi:MAG: abortive infection system toxin AbiGii family protein [Anaeromicrobium sp.]|jgi:hypothetical protein|uniref:abortive infection system toxin AbiGii family protein n=1 Tax=Anaeromicrobium sp. TaxID=1929132 RepID=UPI0025E1D4EC|nr:abortive infection system toxin AbiGii family protein [Anaeromicrobium sp.]MCT4594204.1 abortive infection system toxin AbiGii family protein [Anaeromicrobium sp.]
MSSQKIKNRDNFGLIAQNSNLAFNSYNYDLMNSISELLSEGKIDEAIDLLNNLRKSVVGHHPLYPYYSTEIENRNGKLVFVSKPNSREAIEKYPPRYVGKITIPKKYKHFSSINELITYSYRNQEDIEINVKEVGRVLGDVVDPYQEDIFSPENIQNMKYKIEHKEFPPARPYKIIFSNSKFTMDYVLLRVMKITDKGELIISNAEQDTRLYFEMKMDTQNKKCNFNLEVNEKYKRDVTANLMCISFMTSKKKENEIKIISLEYGEELINGLLDNLSYNSDFGDVEKEKKFLENLKTIEDFYDMKIEIPDEVFNYDMNNAEILAEGIKNKKVSGKFTRCKIEFKINKKFKEDTIKLCNNNEAFSLTYEMIDVSISIFGQAFEIGKVIRRFGKVKIADSKKVMKKLEVLEIGDKISIRYAPADKEVGECIDELCFDLKNIEEDIE